MKQPEDNGYLAETILKTEGMYLAIFDRLSPVNTVGRWDEVWEQAKRKAGSVADKQLYYFNDSWSDYSNSHDLLAWVLNFDGVYRIQVVILPYENINQGDIQEFIGIEGQLALLQCPSGELIVESLYNLGQPNVTVVAKIVPGLYQVQLVADLEEQSQHEFLEDLQAYQAAEGPDWSLYLRRVE